MRHLIALAAVVALLVVCAAYHALSTELEETRRDLSKATADVRHFKGRAYWLEQRYEESLQGMRDEHSLDVFNLLRDLNACRNGKK